MFTITLNQEILEIAQKFSIKPIVKIKGVKMKEEDILSIANEYNNLLDNPSNKEVKLAYNQFKRELIAQYKELKEVIKFEFVTENPYTTSQLMFEDIEKNKRLKVFTGGEYHKSMKSINKIFRAVHDILGHYINKNSFSNNGEFLAYLHHEQTFSDLAKKALFSETIGQNSFYKINNTFAQQKSIIFSNDFMKLTKGIK